MSDFRQLLRGILAALLSSVLILGGLSASLVESGSRAVLVQASPEASSSPTPLPPIPTTLPGAPTYTPTNTPLPSPTPTFPPPPTSCPPPAGWIAITVQADDTLASLAQTYGVTPQQIQASNCFTTTTLPTGSILYVPPLPPTQTIQPSPTETTQPTSTPIPCGPPPNWVLYSVRQGDTLFRLSQVLGVTVSQLQLANCLGSSTVIRGGQFLYVPYIPTPIPSATLQPTPSPSATQTVPLPPTARPSATFTTLPTIAPTETAVPPTLPATDTFTPAPSDTPIPTQVPSPATPGPLGLTSAPPTITPGPGNSTTATAQIMQPGW